MGHDRRGRLGRAGLGPGVVQGVGVHRLQGRADATDGDVQAGEGVGAVQAGVVADHLPRAGHVLQPGDDAALDQVAGLEQAGVDLILDLQGIAAVDEHGGLVGHHHRGPGRAGEAGGPGQPLVGVGQVFVLVLVLMRNEEAVEPLPGHLGPDQRQVLGPESAVGLLVEGLAHRR